MTPFPNTSKLHVALNALGYNSSFERTEAHIRERSLPTDRRLTSL